MATITGLHPHYTYNCMVAAVTAAGMGPSSTPYVITTFQDGKHNAYILVLLAAYKIRNDEHV